MNVLELVDGSKSRNGRQASWDDPDNPDSEDPDYDKSDPWESPDNGSYNMMILVTLVNSLGHIKQSLIRTCDSGGIFR